MEKTTQPVKDPANAGEVDAVDRIRRGLRVGFTLSEVLRMCMGMTIADFGRKYGHSRPKVSQCVNGHDHRHYPDVRNDLARELGVEREDIDHLIDNHT